LLVDLCDWGKVRRHLSDGADQVQGFVPASGDVIADLVFPRRLFYGAFCNKSFRRVDLAAFAGQSGLDDSDLANAEPAESYLASDLCVGLSPVH
jgi:hypothetical protein